MPEAGFPVTGSSPHTRGALTPGTAEARSEWIIPAYAGSTACSSRRAWTWPDHPRIRGEHMHVYPPVSRFDGSSPHTRGAPFDGEKAQRHPRIIPAYAGSTLVTIGSSMLPRDHPRIRGEHRLVWRWSRRR